MKEENKDLLKIIGKTVIEVDHSEEYDLVKIIFEDGSSIKIFGDYGIQSRYEEKR